MEIEWYLASLVLISKNKYGIIVLNIHLLFIRQYANQIDQFIYFLFPELKFKYFSIPNITFYSIP